VPEVVREIDRGHAAGAQLPLDAVPVGQGGGYTFRALWRGRDEGL
jgi:hypothetical protein